MQKPEKAIYKEHSDEFIRKLKEGEQKSQFRLYKEFYHPMYNKSLNIIHDEIEAENVLNQAFFNAFDKIQLFNEGDNLGNWLEDIVVETSMDEKEKKSDIPGRKGIPPTIRKSPNKKKE
ncbi:MAG: RNA polymerase sigma factor [Bacteroidota bacterium]